MFCKNCSQRIDDDRIFCSFCRTKQSNTQKLNLETVIVKEETITIFPQPKYDLSYEKELGATIFGVMILVISFIIAIVKPFTSDLESSYNHFEILGSIASLALRVIVVAVVLDITKRQNRKSFGWGVLAFILPSISLIIVGQLRKLHKQGAESTTSSKREHAESAMDIDNTKIPAILSTKNDKTIFVNGINIEVIKDIQGKFFFVSGVGRHYYKTQDATIRAAYIQKVTQGISKVEIDGRTSTYE